VEKKTKNKVLGVIFLVAPFVLLFLIMILFAASRFIGARVADSSGVEASVGANLFSVILGFSGMIILFLGVPAGIILGIIFLRKKN